MDNETIALMKQITEKSYLTLKDVEAENQITRRQAMYRIDKLNAFLKDSGVSPVAVLHTAANALEIPEDTRKQIKSMIGDGSCAFVSIARGRRADGQAARSIGNAVSLTLLSSLVLTAACFLFMKPLLICFGASVSERTYALAQEYFTYIAMGFPFYMNSAVSEMVSSGAPAARKETSTNWKAPE